MKKFPKSAEVLKAAALAVLLKGGREKAHLAKASFSATLRKEPDFFKKLEELLDRSYLGPLRKLYLREASASAAHISVPETMLARLRFEGLRLGAAAPQVQACTRPPSVAGAWKEAPELPHLPAYANIYALLVGVGSYDFQDISPARFALKDPRLFRDLAVIVMGVRDDADHLVYLENPTMTEFKRALLWAVKRVSSARRRFVVFYAGHGAADPKGRIYWTFRDTDPRYLGATALPFDEVLSFAQKARGKVLVVADVCYAGGGRSLKLPKGIRPTMLKVKMEFASGPQVGFILAAKGDEISQSLEEKGDGGPTYALFRALTNDALDRDEDGWISLGELKGYLERKVVKLSRTAGSVQHPVIRGPGGILLSQVE